jgi:UDP-N-acetylmuramyl pentapeptide phosphotransferase/UDP-N-acetylglucosamine-1-phosphate transferase
MMVFITSAFFVTFLCSALACAILIATKKHHMRARRGDIEAVQSAHAAPTPRIGGVAIVFGLVVSVFVSPETVQSIYLLFILSLAPVFLAGLAEDLGYRLSSRLRLIAAALSSLQAISLLGVWVTHVDILGLDWLLGFTPVAIIFTMFATAGVCSAFNLIDGLNGLSSGTGIVTAMGLAGIAYITGQQQLVLMNLMLIASLLGFLLFNFPWGKIFLGDAGAYSLGHTLAWFSVILMFKEAELTPWAIVLVFFWPLADTLFAMYRRHRSGHPTDQPDRLHFHQLVMRFLEIRFLGRGRRQVANPLATLVMLSFVIVPVIFGVLLWDKPFLAFTAVVVFSVVFVGSFLLGISLLTSLRQVNVRKFGGHK